MGLYVSPAPSTASTTSNYSQAYFTGATWSTTSTTLADPTPTGTNSITVRQHNGLSLSAAASNGLGITFTPASSTSAYLIAVTYNVASLANSQVSSTVLTDGSTIIAQGGGTQGNGVNGANDTLVGIYFPGTTSSVTVKMQLAVQSGGTISINSVNQVSPAIPIEWTVVQIA